MPYYPPAASSGGGVTSTTTNNTFAGSSAGATNASNDETYFGANAGSLATSSTGKNGNTFVGSNAGKVTNEEKNTFIGANAGLANGSGYWNTFVGHDSGAANTIGFQNVYIGNRAGDLASSSGSSNNVAIGVDASISNDGSHNTAVGKGSLNGTGNDDCTMLGYGATASNSLSFATAIGSGASVTTSNSIALGRSSDKVGIAMTAPTAKLHLPAGTATAGTAPLKFTSGTNLTTIENGTFEYDGSKLYFSTSGKRFVINPFRTATAISYTALLTDYYIGITDTSSARTITLPPAATAGSGKTYIITDESGGAGTNNITVQADGAELINGANTQIMNVDYSSIQLMCTGAKWTIF